MMLERIESTVIGGIMTRFGQILLVAIFAVTAMGFSTGNCAAQANLITGCDEGAYVRDRQAFPRESRGYYPDQFLDWIVFLAKGYYTIQVLSRYDFDHVVFFANTEGRNRRIKVPPARRIDH